VCGEPVCGEPVCGEPAPGLEPGTARLQGGCHPPHPAPTSNSGYSTAPTRCPKPHRLTPFRVTNHVTPDHTSAWSALLVLHRVLQLIDESDQRAGDRHGPPWSRQPGQPWRRRRPRACRTVISSASPHGRGRKGEHLRGERGHLAAKGIVHPSKVVPRIVLRDLCPELIYRASNARSADERAPSRRM
jgi:hypothetical protein